jgi:hypothetical protein
MADATRSVTGKGSDRDRLARLKAERSADSDREARIEEALTALKTLPDTIQLGYEDAKWVAQDADIEDL